MSAATPVTVDVEAIRTAAAAGAMRRDVDLLVRIVIGGLEVLGARKTYTEDEEVEDEDILI